MLCSSDSKVTNAGMIHTVLVSVLKAVQCSEADYHGHGEETLIRDAYIYLTQKTYPDGSTANEN